MTRSSQGVAREFRRREPPPAACVSDGELVDQLATRLNVLSPGRLNPERFHEERDGIVRALRALAKRLDGRPVAVAPMTSWRSGCAR